MNLSGLFKSKYFGWALLLLVLGIIAVVVYPIFKVTNVVTQPFTTVENAASTAITGTESAVGSLWGDLKNWLSSKFPPSTSGTTTVGS